LAEIVIKPGDGITQSAMDDILPKLADAVQQCGGDAVIDCSHIDSMDAVDVALLLGASKYCRDAGGNLSLRHTTDKVAGIIRILGLEDLFDLTS